MSNKLDAGDHRLGERPQSVRFRIGLGCMALTGIYGNVDRRNAIAVIHRALDLGITHFDTAELYGPYANEELLAEALGPCRHEVKIATKFGYKIDRGKVLGLDSNPSSIRRAVEGSLRRLKRERIDLLYQHRLDPSTPVEDVVGTMADLVNEGKVAALGLSKVGGAILQRAQMIHTIDAVQNEYSLIHRDSEVNLMPELNRHATNLVSFSPLGRGILCGNVQTTSDREASDHRITDARFANGNLSNINRNLQPLWDIARRREVSPAAVALAWLLGKSPNVSVIPGAKSPAQIVASMQARELELSKGEEQELNGCNVAGQARPSPGGPKGDQTRHGALR